ncbi:MAG: hypothetical protein M1134_02755 [Actinobacteria bacterium]|nr:hypothetical protein [Actinomycetota bacterium]
MPELNDINLSDVTKTASKFVRDVAYVTVGLGVLGVQKAQVRRVEIQRKLANDASWSDRIDEVREAVFNQAHHVDTIVESAVNLFETTIEPLEDQLPVSAKELSQKAREQARHLRSQIRDLVLPAA